MEFLDFIKNTIPITTIELLAAIAGTYYLQKTTYTRSTFFLVLFLWLTFLVEITGSYPAIAYFSDFKYFSFVKDTPFQENYWLYNCFIIFSFSFYAYYFRSFLKNTHWRRIMKYLMAFYAISATGYLLISEVFFKVFSPFSVITGTVLLIVSVIFFYFELLRSNMLVDLKKLLPFYISIGALLFNLCITPLDIFSEYFKNDNQLFVRLRINVLLYANLFMYSVIILGFIICSGKKRSY